MGIPLPAKGVRRSNRGRSFDRRDVWVGPKPTARLQTSRGHRHRAKEIPRRKTLFGVDGGVRFKNDLTGPALLEMSGNATIRPLTCEPIASVAPALSKVLLRCMIW